MFIIPQLGQAIKRSAYAMQVATTLVVFLVLFIFTLISWQNSKHALEVQKNQVIKERSDLINETIISHLSTSSNLTLAGAALFEGSEAVSRDEWHRFYNKLQVEINYSGVTSVGYVPIVRSSERDIFEQNMRTEGLGDYAIFPFQERDRYAPIMYSQNYGSGKSTLGYDMFSDTKRKQAMDKAAATGANGLTESVTLQDTKVPGIILYTPVYIRDAPTNSPEERKSAIHGFVFARLHIHQLFKEILPTNGNDFGVVVKEVVNSKQHELYSSLPDVKLKNLKLARSSNLNLYGKNWVVSAYAGNDIVSAADNQRPWIVLQAGLLISLIASAAVFLLIKYRTRAFATEEERRLQQAKNELLSLASHQLRTPATGVKQYVSMVLDGYAGKVNKKQIELLTHAYQSNERQLQIINDFLYVAKLDSGSLKTTAHKFDLAFVVRDVVNEMDGEIKEKNHKLELDLPRTLSIKADEHSVRMIIENLLSNAIRYTKPGGKISVTLKRVLNDIQLSVQDSGIGISKKDMPLLFKQFSRIPNELSREVNGSGIGLYLAQQLAHRNGGKITVASKSNKGATFTLHLKKKSVKYITKKRRKA